MLGVPMYVKRMYREGRIAIHAALTQKAGERDERSGGATTRDDNPRMESFGLWGQRRGHGDGWPRKQTRRGKRAGKAVVRKDLGGVTPICTLMGEPADGRCPGRSG